MGGSFSGARRSPPLSRPAARRRPDRALRAATVERGRRRLRPVPVGLYLRAARKQRCGPTPARARISRSSRPPWRDNTRLQAIHYAESSAESGADLHRRCAGAAAAGQYRCRKERRGGPAGAGIHLLGAWELDELAAARAYRDAGEMYVYINMPEPGVWHSVGL